MDMKTWSSKSLQATRDRGSSSAFVEVVIEAPRA